MKEDRKKPNPETAKPLTAREEDRGVMERVRAVHADFVAITGLTFLDVVQAEMTPGERQAIEEAEAKMSKEMARQRAMLEGSTYESPAP